MRNLVPPWLWGVQLFFHPRNFPRKSRDRCPTFAPESQGGLNYAPTVKWLDLWGVDWIQPVLFRKHSAVFNQPPDPHVEVVSEFVLLIFSFTLRFGTESVFTLSFFEKIGDWKFWLESCKLLLSRNDCEKTRNFLLFVVFALFDSQFWEGLLMRTFFFQRRGNLPLFALISY